MLPSLPVFFYICDYLGITPKEFFDFCESPDLELAEAMHKLCRLTKEKRQHIIAVINDLE